MPTLIYLLPTIEFVGLVSAVFTLQRLSRLLSDAQNALEWERQDHHKTRAKLADANHRAEMLEGEIEVYRRRPPYR